MEIVLDKSYLKGVPRASVRQLCEEHTVLFTEALLFELLTTTAEDRGACFGKLPKTDTPVTLIPRAGPLMRYENKRLQAASPLREHKIDIDYQFNPALATGDFEHSAEEQAALDEWKAEVANEVETFHEIATGVSDWCPRLREVSGDELQTGCDELKRQACEATRVVQNVYRSLNLEDFACASLLDPSWVLFRWTQMHLLFSLDYIARYGFEELDEIPKRVEHDIHDIQYTIFGSLCGAIATRDHNIGRNFQLACPDGLIVK